MKRIFLLSVLVVIYIVQVFPQGGNFKHNNRVSVRYQTSFTPKVIKGNTKLKSTGTGAHRYAKAGTIPLNSPNLAKEQASIEKEDSITPIFYKRKNSSLKEANNKPVAERCMLFLESIKQEMRMASPSKDFVITNIKRDDLGQEHIRISQKYKGIKVYSSDFYVHFSADYEIMNGRYCIIHQEINTVPKISSEKALQIAKAEITKVSPIKELTQDEKELLNYESPIIDTFIYKNENPLKPYSLVFQITIRPNIKDEWICFIDAETGSIITKYNNTKFDGPATANAVDLNGISRNINTYLESGKYYMIDIAEPMFNAAKGEGMIRTINAQNTSTKNLSYIDITSTNNTWNNPAAVSAHYNATQTYKYFKNTFNRNSINGQGGNIISLINVADDNGQSMENAFWNGAAIFYGNGGTYFKPLAGALDVAAHEIGHGITDNTAALIYQGESGAINEAFSDIFGSMVDRTDWYIGEDVTKTSYITTGRLRDMSNPHNDGANGWQPKHTSEKYTGNEDNGGVHVNSGIINYAYYLYATAVSKEKAEQVFYRALTTYLTKSSQFIDLRLAALQSARDLYGENSTEANQVNTSFDAVGIYTEQPVDASSTYAENPGTEYILMDNTDSGDPNSLYQSSVTATNFIPLSTTKMKRRASVVDNGAYAVFVSDDSKLRSITLTSGPTESILSNDAIWNNAAISKDGNRLAAITNVIDTSIYVYDFTSSKWARFILYNPTTQENVKSTGVLYADVIEFDHTGQYLIYDAFNRINSTTGDSIEYWDIGIIKVWDNKTNQFGDGSISKLFGSLPDSVSIGNPTFSKNSPGIIAFDYLKESSNEYAIMGLNIETNDLGVIANNNTIGFPSYSKKDDKVIFGALNNSSRPIINVATLNANKISSSAAPVTIILEAQWPVYYATGTRVLGLAPVANFSASYKSGAAPLTVKFTDNSKNEPTSWQWTFTGGTPSSSTAQNPTVTYNSLGNYAVTLKATNSFGNNTITKSGYIVISTGIKDVQESQKSYFIYPNPAKDRLYIDNLSNLNKKVYITVYTISGKPVKSETYNESVDISNLKKGLYILKIDDGNGVVQSKFLKE
jgi:Zn-dependent metalloprotease/PKD repeat protein